MVIKEILILKDNLLSFGNYEVEDKQKLEDFSAFGNKYKVKTHKVITRLEKNDTMLLETVPGSTVHAFDENEISFAIEGYSNTQITMELEPNTEYKLIIDDEVVGKTKSNAFGKYSFSLNLTSEPKHVVIKKI